MYVAQIEVRRIDERAVAFFGGDFESPQSRFSKRILDRAEKAAEFMEIIRQGLDDFPIGLSAWKQPSAHRSFPWEAFRSRCDLDLPQVFWIGRHGEAARQLETSYKQFSVLQPRRPYLPAGPAFFEDNWRPSPEEIIAFLEKAQALGVPAASLWNWDYLGLTGEETDDNPERLDFREHWQAAADFGWSVKTTDDRQRGTEEETVIRPTPEPEAMSAPTIVRQPEPTPEPEVAVAPTIIRWPEPISEPEAAPEPDLDFELELLVEPEAEDELPEWLQFLNSPETQIEPEPAEAELDFAIEIEAEDDLPEWLQFLNESQPPTESSAPSPAETELVSPADQETEEELEELPDWLQFTSQPKPELPFETSLSPSEPTSEPEPFTAEPISEASKPEETEPPQPELTPIPSEPPSEPALAVTAESLLEVSQPEEAEPPQPDLTPSPAESPFEPAFAVTAEALPEVSPPEEVEPAQPDLTPTPAESPFEPTFVVTTEALPEISKPQELEPSQSASIPEPAATKEPKPIFFTAPAPPTSTRGSHLPKRAAARVAPTSALIPRDDTVSQFFDALRNGEPELAVTFYGAGFVHVNRDRVEHNPTTLAGFYTALLEQIDGPELAWSTIPMARAIVNVKWNTLNQAGKPVHGTDTFHLNPAGQIVYHHTSFRIENGVTP